MAYQRNPRRRVIRGRSSDELRRGGRRTSEELDIEGDDMPFVRLGSSSIGTAQDVVQRIGNAIIGGDFGGNARGEGAIDIQIERLDSLGAIDVTRVASGVDSVAFGRNSRAGGVGSVAIGSSAFADGPYAVAFGSGEARGDGSFAIGGVVTAGSSYGIVLGGQATVTAQYGIAIGEIANATAAGAIAIGSNETYATAQFAIAIGEESRSDGLRAVAIGYIAGYAADAGGDPVASGARSVLLGMGAYTATADQAVIAATTLKMQTARVGSTPPVFTYESVITTSDAAPVTGNLAQWADVDRVEDAGFAASDVALTTGKLSQFAATTSAELAGVLSDETGYSAGALAVFSISPVLTTPNLGTPSALVLTNATGLPTAGLVDAAVTLAKMANLAQDQFIGRTTASTGVPETTTITAAARTVLDDVTVAAMVDTLGGASSVGSGGLARATSPVFATQISTPAIVAPAALTVTPAAGSGVNIVLSTTGDFAVNTNQFYVDTSTIRTGFGTNNPLVKVHIVGSGEILRVESTLAVGNSYLAFYDSSARKGYFGYGGGATDQLVFFNGENSYMSFSNNSTEFLRLSAAGGLSLGSSYVSTDPGHGAMILSNKLGIITNVPTNILSLGGNAARTMWMERHTTANTAGNTLTVQAGGATASATDKAGGDLLLQPGVSTGSAESGVQIYGVVAGASGTADRTQTKAIQVLGNKIGFYAVTPVVRPTALTAALTAITHTAPGTPDYALQDLTAGGFGFVTADEGNTALSVLVRTALRVEEIGTKLQALGLLT